MKICRGPKSLRTASPPVSFPAGGEERKRGRQRASLAVVLVVLTAAWIFPFPLLSRAQQEVKEVSYHGVIQDRLRRPPSIRVGDVIVDVSKRTVIRDLKGNPVRFEDLHPFQEVTVTGFPVGSKEIAAREIVVTPPVPR